MLNTILMVVGISLLVGLPFLLYGVYYSVIGLMGLRKYNTFKKEAPKNKLCAVVAARNESMVIGNLIDTLKAQNYPEDLSDIYVLPNNCTDNTAEVALRHGAKVFHCSDEVHSKGAALDEFFTYALENEDYDAFCVFDADNLVDSEFFAVMNNVLCSGETIAQGYRDSKNPADSWISGSQSIFYWILNRFLNLARHNLGLSAALNGTGFMVSSEILRDGGFKTFSLTEDIEFTTQSIIKGHRVAWVPEAKTYDEHPLTFDVSWKQRKRWSTGTIECFNHYAPILWKTYRKTRRFACLDMIFYLSAPLVQVFSSILGIVTGTALLVVLFQAHFVPLHMIISAILFLFSMIWSVFFCVTVVLLEKHKVSQINKKSFFTFWFWLMSWTIINMICIVAPIKTWEPIAHTKSVSLSQINLSNNEQWESSGMVPSNNR